MLHKRAIKEKLLKGSAWAFSGKVLTALSGLAISMLLTRLLTPGEMGIYFLAFSLASVAAIVAQLGLTQTIVRLVAESMGTGRPERARQSIILVLKLAAFSVFFIVCFIAFGLGELIAEKVFKSTIMLQLIGLVAVWTVIITFQKLIAEVYRGFHDIRLATILGGLATSVFSMLLFSILWLIQGKGNLEQILTLTLGAGLSSILISSAVLWNKLNKLPSGSSQITLVDIMNISWPLWITSLAILLLAQAALWIMGIFRLPSEVAVFGAAGQVLSLVAMPLLIVNAVVPPIISEMYVQEDLESLEKSLRNIAFISSIPALLVLVVFIFFGGLILGFLFGEFYQTGGMILIILSVGQLVNVWAGSCGQVLMLTGYQTTMMVITIFCGVITVVLAWVLVEAYGGVGVAVAASTGLTMQNFFMLLAVKNKLGIWTHVTLSFSSILK